MNNDTKYLYKEQEVHLVCLCENFALIQHLDRNIFAKMFEWINPKDLKEFEVINETY